MKNSNNLKKNSNILSIENASNSLHSTQSDSRTLPGTHTESQSCLAVRSRISCVVYQTHAHGPATQSNQGCTLLVPYQRIGNIFKSLVVDIRSLIRCRSMLARNRRTKTSMQSRQSAKGYAGGEKMHTLIPVINKLQVSRATHTSIFLRGWLGGVSSLKIVYVAWRSRNRLGAAVRRKVPLVIRSHRSCVSTGC